jgi:hypothetical protein
LVASVWREYTPELNSTKLIPDSLQCSVTTLPADMACLSKTWGAYSYSPLALDLTADHPSLAVLLLLQIEREQGASCLLPCQHSLSTSPLTSSRPGSQTSSRYTEAHRNNTVIFVIDLFCRETQKVFKSYEKMKRGRCITSIHRLLLAHDRGRSSTWYRATTSTKCSFPLCLLLLLLHQCTLDTLQVLHRLLLQMPWLGTRFDRKNHLANLCFRIDMRAYAREAVVCKAAKAAVLHTRHFEGTAAEWVHMLTGYARNHLQRSAVCIRQREFGVVVSNLWHIDATEWTGS